MPTRPIRALPPVRVAAAVVPGILIAILDSRPGFDDTGVTAGLLVVAGFWAVVVGLAMWPTQHRRF
jgi:CHASE2 domain-containing sensor protein